MNILPLFSYAPKRLPGIYRIINRRTGQFYIGATTRTIVERWRRHRSELRSGRHHNKQLQADWDKYGARAFRFVVVEVIRDSDEVFTREKYWQRLEHNNKCYNPHPDDMPFRRRRWPPMDYASPEGQAALLNLCKLLRKYNVPYEEIQPLFTAIGVPINEELWAQAIP